MNTAPQDDDFVGLFVFLGGAMIYTLYTNMHLIWT